MSGMIYHGAEVLYTLEHLIRQNGTMFHFCFILESDMPRFFLAAGNGTLFHSTILI
jgi:hypothetical protein